MTKPRFTIEATATYSVDDACRWLGWERHTFYRVVRERQIPVIKGGREWKFLGQHLLNLAQPLEVR